MKNKFYLLLVIFSLIAVPTISSAAETNIANEYPSLNRGARPLAMGNAFLTMKGTDDNAAFYNPAAINDFEGFHFSFGANPFIDLSTSIYTLTKDVIDLSKDLGDVTADSDKTTIFQDFTTKHIGDFQYLNVGYPLIAFRHHFFYLGVITDSRTSISLRNQAFTNFEFKMRNDAGVYLGGAHSFFFDDLQIGLGLKVLYRAGIEDVITADSILASDDLTDDLGWSQWKKGIGVGADLGVKYQVPDFGVDILDTLKPTVAATYQDIANTRFSGGAENTPQSVSVGVGIHPTLGDFHASLGETEASIVADFRELNQKKHWLNKFHAGAEIRFPTLAKVLKPSLRAGTNQGYLAAGAGFEFIALRYRPIINFAYYGEELGEVNHEKSSYRLAAELRLVNF
ncbi:hypothetical protein KKA47_07220 [bacterium]|nr:hypothetical protein [bacterium]